MGFEKKLDQFDKRLEEMGVRIKDANQFKVSENVFDDVTLLALYKLVNKKWLSANWRIYKYGERGKCILW